MKRLFKCKLYSKYLCMYCMYVCLSVCVYIVCLSDFTRISRFTIHDKNVFRKLLRRYAYDRKDIKPQNYTYV